MPEYTVKQGDCISSIAYRYGFFPDTIWNDPKNSELKRKRKDPNVLAPGDLVYIPDKRIKEVSGATKQRHRFRKKGVPEKLVIQFKNNDEARANEAYVLDIDGDLTEGTTDGDGKVEIPIVPNAKKATIMFPESGDDYELDLGDLDPITDVSGVQARLQNLGFFKGEVDGKLSNELEQGIRAFQERHKLEATGNLDDDTRNKIQDIYGK